MAPHQSSTFERHSNPPLLPESPHSRSRDRGLPLGGLVQQSKCSNNVTPDCDRTRLGPGPIPLDALRYYLIMTLRNRKQSGSALLYRLGRCTIYSWTGTRSDATSTRRLNIPPNCTMIDRVGAAMMKLVAYVAVFREPR